MNTLASISLLLLTSLASCQAFLRNVHSKSHINPKITTIMVPFSAVTNKATTLTAMYATTNNNNKYDEICDILVLGSGPAARSIAALLAVQHKVVVADQNFDRSWPPNYGVWLDEWQAILERYTQAGVQLTGGNIGTALDRQWPVTDCYFGGSFDIPVQQRLRIDRPYGRVDRDALRESLTTKYKVLRANHRSQAIGVNVYAPAGSLVHDDTGSTIQLETKDKQYITVRSKLLVDCTGHETKLVLRDTRDPYRPPGFQIAYGCLVKVDETNVSDLTRIGPYDKEAMTLFDYRTDHFDQNDAVSQEAARDSPTFMYAMPLEGNRIFFEETSLVARPAMSFQECKDRCFQRLEYLGIAVTEIEEEEYCYIPMGGALPAKDQRILAVGGSAAMVHPSTGYHLCRCLMGAADVARVVEQELASSDLNRVAAAAYHALWSPENIRQRNFAVFGGEFLMKQNVIGLRGFFDGFFRLPLELWGGFLAGWPGLPNNVHHESWWSRMWFGLTFVTRLPLVVALDMLSSIVWYILEEGVPLAQSVTPFLGAPASYEYQSYRSIAGDVAAKTEARRMISASKVSQEVPVTFDQSADVATESDQTLVL